MRILRRLAWGFFVIFGGGLALGQADLNLSQGADNSQKYLDSSSLFQRGRYELTLANGVMFSPVIAIGHRPTINYTMTEIQLGYMLSDVEGEGWLRGNFEFVGEVLGNWIFQGEGSWIAGGTLWVRYNFVQPGTRLLPFAQGGLGMVSTDISHKIDGQPFNFNLEIGLGTRYLLSDRWSINAEFRYQHISNADTAKHNLGVNSFGPILGISYLF